MSLGPPRLPPMKAQAYETPYDEDMTRKQVLVQLDDRTVKELDRLAKRLKVSRSELLRRGAEDLLERVDELEAILKYEKSYREHPQTEEELAWVLASEKSASEVLPKW